MDFNKVVLFSDLDGTLFDDDTKVPDRNRTAIQQFCEDGGIFCISSGRTPLNIEGYLSGIQVNGPCILYNGSAVYDWKNRKILCKQTLNMKKAEAFTVWVLKNYPEVDLQVYPGDEICFVSPKELANSQFVTCHQPCKFTTLEQVEKPWLKILMQGEPEALKHIRSYGEQIAEIGTFVSTSVDYLELLPEGVSKGAALQHVMELPELQGRVAVAIGDFYNDIELLKNAHIGMAPQNALPEVKTIADYIVCSNNLGAVAECIDRILEIKM